MKSYSLRMPLRFMRGSHARLALTVVALACGVALVCAVDLVNRAVFWAFAEIVDTMAGRAALQVSAGDRGLFAETVAAEIGSVAGVELAVPVVTATAFVADESGELVTVHGIDITNDDAVRVYEGRDAGGDDIDDPLVFLSQPDSIALTRVFADRRSLSIGSQVDLDTPGGRRRFIVRGLLSPAGVARVHGGGLVVMDIYAAEAMFARPGFVNRVDVVVRRDEDVGVVRDAIAAALPPGLRVETPAQRKADLHRVIGSLQVMLQGMGLVGLVAAFLIAFNRLTTVFEARTGEIGVLRAVGVSSRDVWIGLLKESLVLGAAGVALGIPFGIGLGRLLLPIIATTTALSYKLVATEPQLSLDPLPLVIATALGIGAAVLAAALPAWRVARLDVSDVLRAHGREHPDSDRPWRLIAPVMVGVGILVTVVLQWGTSSAVWGLVATALIAVATALASRPFMTMLAPGLLRALRWPAGPVARFATASVIQKPRRAALTVALVGVGLGSATWLSVIGGSFEKSLLDALSPALAADLIVGSANIESGAFEAPLDGRLADELRAIPGVVATAAERVVDWHHDGGPIVIEAFDANYFRTPELGEWKLLGAHLPGAWESVARGEATVVSSSFALNLGARVGDTLLLETPSGPLSLRVAGVTTDFASPRGTIKLSRELYRTAWYDDHVTLVLIDAAASTDINDLRAAIGRGVGGQLRRPHSLVSRADELLHGTGAPGVRRRQCAGRPRARRRARRDGRYAGGECPRAPP